MKITVNEQPQTFWLAFPDKWVEGTGHEIKVGDYRFSAIPITGKNNRIEINVSEVTSGMRVMTIPIDPIIYYSAGTKEDSLEYFHHIGKRLKKIIEKVNMDKHLKNARKRIAETHGDMPEIKYYEGEIA